MKRLTLFMLFLLLAGLLAPAHFARAETSYYGVQFDEVDDYATINVSLSGDFTFIALLRFNCDKEDDWEIIRTTGYKFWIYSNPAYTWGNILIGNGTDYVVYANVFKNYFSRATQLYAVSVSGPTVKAYVNAQNIFTATDLPYEVAIDGLRIPIGGAKTVYLVLIYNRALSDSEIQAIYADPLHPPTSGLVLFYAPDSVDTATNTWHDKSGNGNDGSIVGATYVPLRPLSESEPSKDAPVALEFDGASSHIDVLWDMSIEDFTIVAIARAIHQSGYRVITSAGIAPNKRPAFDFIVRGDGSEYFLVGNESSWQYGAYTPAIPKYNYHQYAVAYENGVGATFYVDANALSKTVNIPGQLSSPVKSSFLRIGAQANPTAYFFNGTITYLLFYSRALSDEEIREIYENPNNPPLDGLVLWYDPYSYDPISGKWLNRAPIFPTIPLAEELDGVNYGATPERVSIPKLSVYDAQNNTLIPPENVSVALLENNTAISLLPSFLTLPYNETVKLNVSAINHQARILNVTTPLEYIAAYLNSQPGEESLPELFNYRIFNLTQVNFSNVTLEDYTKLFEHWPGGGLLKGLWEMNLTEFLHDVFAFDVSVEGRSFAWVGVLLVALIWFGGSLVAWFRFKDPIPTLAFSRVLYEGLGYFSPPAFTVLRAPVAAFMLYMGYLLIKNLLAKWSGER